MPTVSPPRPARLALAALLTLAAGGASAQTAPPAAGSGDLTVAVTPAPPFVEAGDDGTWDGLGVHLAREVAGRLGRGVRFVQADDPVAAVAGGAADLAVVPATAEAEGRVDFTPSFYAARLGVARTATSGIADVAGRFFSPTFFKTAAGLSALLFLVGLAIWAVERDEDGDDFREGKAGIWDGFWWSGVTMTTIGYGDTVPTSVAGRSLALLWMLVSMAVTAALTAALVSALGLQGSSGGGASIPGDLREERVGVVGGSTAAGVLREARVGARTVPTVEAGLRAVADDSLDALIGSAPLLRASRSDGTSGLQIETTGVEFERWAFAVAEGSPLREVLSRGVLERVQSPDWSAAVDRYTSSGG